MARKGYDSGSFGTALWKRGAVALPHIIMAVRDDSDGRAARDVAPKASVFYHPRTKKPVDFEAPLPEDFKVALKLLRDLNKQARAKKVPGGGLVKSDGDAIKLLL